MNKKYNNVIHIFFSDYLAWLLIVSSLFVVSCVLAIAFGKAQGFIWIIPVLFLVIYCCSLQPLVLYCKVKKDIKDRNIEHITIKSFKIEQDGTFGFKNRGGAAVGKRKYRIIDENGNYVICGGDFNKDLLGNSEEIFGRSGEGQTWAQPFPTEYLEGKDLTLVSSLNEENPLPSCRNADGPYNDNQFVLTVDGFLVSANVSVNSCYVSNGEFLYSDHNPVMLKFVLNA